MGFISSASTVTVQAFLTTDGKKKLFDSIDAGESGFASKFSLGDSDIDYRVIENGNPILSGGSVPEASNFKPRMKSYVLSAGKYFPAIPTLLVDGSSGPVFNTYLQLSLSQDNLSNSFRNIQLGTEWPRGTTVSEEYRVEIVYPSGIITEEVFDRLFNVRLNNSTLIISQISPLDLSDIASFTGVITNGEVVFSVRIVGETSHAISVLNVILTI